MKHKMSHQQEGEVSINIKVLKGINNSKGNN